MYFRSGLIPTLLAKVYDSNFISLTCSFPNTPGTVTINNNTDTLRRLQNPVYEETALNGLLPSEVDPQTGHGDNSEETGPTYEIIPLPAIVNKKASKENGNIPREKDGEETGKYHGVRYIIVDDNLFGVELQQVGVCQGEWLRQ